MNDAHICLTRLGENFSLICMWLTGDRWLIEQRSSLHCLFESVQRDLEIDFCCIFICFIVIWFMFVSYCDVFQADGMPKQQIFGKCGICKSIMKAVKKKLSSNATPVGVMINIKLLNWTCISQQLWLNPSFPSGWNQSQAEQLLW